MAFEFEFAVELAPKCSFSPVTHRVLLSKWPETCTYRAITNTPSAKSGLRRLAPKRAGALALCETKVKFFPDYASALRLSPIPS